jgi:hypothetical protein
MGVILFFTMSLMILVVGFTYTFFAIRHHWRLSRQKSLGADRQE